MIIEGDVSNPKTWEPIEERKNEMNDILFCGDVHGKQTEFRAIIGRNHDKEIIQVGDMGFGFKGVDTSPFPERVRFIRGNHDDPDACRKHPNYLGDFGYDERTGIFFVSGAFSIDKDWRIEGVSWWREEELSTYQFDQCIELYKKVKPEIVVSHDCPLNVRSHIFNITHHDEQSITNKGLDEMLFLYRPKLWVFGHHHQSRNVNLYGTVFQCLGELETISITQLSPAPTERKERS